MNNHETPQTTSIELDKSKAKDKTPFYKKPAVIIAGIAGLALAASSALAGCSNTEAQPEPTLIETTQTPTPEPAPSETEEPLMGEGVAADYEVTPEVSEKLNAMENMSVEEFNELPREDRLLYVDLAMRDIGTEGMLIPFFDRYDINIRDTRPTMRDFEPKSTDDGQQIIYQSGFLEQLTLTPKTWQMLEDSDKPFNADRGAKLMSGLFYYNQSDQPGEKNRDVLRQGIYKNTYEGSIIKPVQFVSSSEEINEWIDPETEKTLFVKNIIVHPYDFPGKSYTQEYCLTPYVNIYDEPAALWQLVDSK